MNGKYAVSALATTDIGPKATATIESKNDECGAIAIIGASFGDARFPFTLIRWIEPAKYAQRIVNAPTICNALKIDQIKCLLRQSNLNTDTEKLDPNQFNDS